MSYDEQLAAEQRINADQHAAIQDRDRRLHSLNERYANARLAVSMEAAKLAAKDELIAQLAGVLKIAAPYVRSAAIGIEHPTLRRTAEIVADAVAAALANAAKEPQ